MRATAHLPGLAIEIVHRRSPDDEEEQISINFKATPSFEAFGRFIDGANPLALWANLMRLAWAPWHEVGRIMMPPWLAQTLPPPTETKHDNRRDQVDI